MKKYVLAFAIGILSAQLLAQGTEVKNISFKDALTKVLEKHFLVKLAHIRLEEAKAQNAKQISKLLPKLSLKTGYTRNIPEIKTSLQSQNDQSGFYRQVATLLRAQGKTAEADDIERQADLLGRRNDSDQLIISPKNLFNAGLLLEIPLFNGPRLVQALMSKSYVDFEQAHVEEEKAGTLYQAALAYYRVIHLEKILKIRQDALSRIKDRYEKALTQRKSGQDFLEIEAHYLLRKAEFQGAQINYRASLNDLAQMMDMGPDFNLEEPGDEFLALSVDEEQLISMALANRADLAAQKKAMLIADGEKLQGLMQFLPILTLEGQANYTSNNKGLSKENFTYAISLNASMALFDGGISLLGLRENALKRQANELRLNQIEKEIHTNIRMRKEKIEQLKVALDAYNAAKRFKQENLKISVDRFNRGLIRQEEYLLKSDQEVLARLDHEKAHFEVMEQQLLLSHEAGLLTPSTR